MTRLLMRRPSDSSTAALAALLSDGRLEVATKHWPRKPRLNRVLWELAEMIVLGRKRKGPVPECEPQYVGPSDIAI